jgi:protein-tyrosine phosphatase
MGQAKLSGLPFPLDVTRISPRLYVGSIPPAGRVLRNEGFDLLVLCASPIEYKFIYGLSGRALDSLFEGVRVLHVPLDDDNPSNDNPNAGRPTDHDLVLVYNAVNEITTAVLREKRVLITCMQGRNRSAFVAALVLHRLTGWSGAASADHVRKKRSRDANAPVLVNYWFDDILRRIPPSDSMKTVRRETVRP